MKALTNTIRMPQKKASFQNRIIHTRTHTVYMYMYAYSETEVLLSYMRVGTVASW